MNKIIRMAESGDRRAMARLSEEYINKAKYWYNRSLNENDDNQVPDYHIPEKMNRKQLEAMMQCALDRCVIIYKQYVTCKDQNKKAELKREHEKQCEEVDEYQKLLRIKKNEEQEIENLRALRFRG